MQTFVHSVALLATLIALVAAMVTDHGLLTACKRALISYFGFYLVASLLVLAFRGGVLAESRKEKPARGGKSRPGTAPDVSGSPPKSPQEAA